MTHLADDTTQRFLPILRVTLGFMYFSAFLRRVINVPSKLIPTSPKYVGGKIITFIPHAWAPIRPLLENTLNNPAALYNFLILLTILEGIFGLFMMLGFLTKPSGLIIALLAWGIGLGAGWLGSTCLDEWQIASVEGAAALMFMFTGSRWFSIDQYLSKKYPNGLKIWKIKIPLW